MADAYGTRTKLITAAAEQSDGDLAQPVLGSPESTVESVNTGLPGLPADSRVFSGAAVGRYRLEKILGRGGFGEVWRAHDPELDRTVAIKVARSDRELSSRVLDGLHEEARKAASLSHPGIVQVHDVGHDGELFFIVSECIDGESLADRLHRSPLSANEAVSITIDIARALHYAHVRDLIHRDVKPGNILLRSSGAAVLTDLGLALFEKELAQHGREVTGTVHFMSPEQALGDLSRVDHRTDIFSLGLVLYYMLSGRLPYPPGSTEAYLQYLTTREPRPVRSVVESIPPELERICMRCLAMAPKDRYSTCLELTECLDAWRHQSLEPPLFSPSKSPLPPANSNRNWNWLTGAAPLAFLLAILIPWQLPKYPPNRTPPEGPGIARPPLPPEPPPELPFVQNAHWTPLLRTMPRIVAWGLGDGRKAPQFDANQQQLSIRSERTRWLVQCADLDSHPFRIRLALSLQDWVGYGGVVWGLRPDPDAFPEPEYRCLGVEFSRGDAEQPSSLIATEFFLRQYQHDMIGFYRRRPIARTVVPTPKTEEIALEMEVDSEGIRVRFGPEHEWRPLDVLGETEWLPKGRGAIGFMGEGRNITIRSAAIQLLP